MQIVRIVAENFMSFQHFNLLLKDRGLLCIEGENADMGGSNGSGKSSIFEALIWCLFGVTSRGIKAGEVVRRDQNNEPVGNTMVLVQIDLDGVNLLVARYRDHKKYGNKMMLVADGNELTMGGDKETQQRLQQMLQIDYASFISAVMFPQGAAGFPGLSDSEQKAILERVLAVGRFSLAHKITKDRIALLQQKEVGIGTSIVKQSAIQATSRATIESLKGKSNQFLISKTKMLEHLRATFEVERTVCLRTDPTLRPKLASLDEVLSKYNKQTLEASLAEATKGYLDWSRQEAQAKSAVTTYELVLAQAAPSEVADPGIDVPTALKAAQTLQRGVLIQRAVVSQSDNAIRTTNRELQIANTATHCTQCKQLLPAEARDKVLQGLQASLVESERSKADAETQLKQLEAGLVEAEEKLTAARSYADYCKVLDSQEQSRKALQVARDAYTNAKGNLESVAKNVDHAKSDMQAYNSLVEERAKIHAAIATEDAQQAAQSRKVEELRLKVQEQENLVDPYATLIDDAQRQLHKVARDIQFLTLVQRQLNEQIAKLEIWEEGFSNKGVKSLLFDTVTPYLSYQSSQYLHDLSGGTARMTFNTQKTLSSGDLREKFNVEVAYTGGACNYDSISGGERRRVDVSALFALGDLGSSRSLVPIKLRLLDEPFDNLDSVGAEQVAALLVSRIVPAAGTVIVIAHDEGLKALMPSRVVVRKKNGISSIISGAEG